VFRLALEMNRGRVEEIDTDEAEMLIKEYRTDNEVEQP
jgi:hypothetical protein